MPSWWASIEVLSRVSSWFRLATLLLSFAVVAAAGLMLVFQRRISTLQAALLAEGAAPGREAGMSRPHAVSAASQAPAPAATRQTAPEPRAPARRFSAAQRKQFLAAIQGSEPVAVHVAYFAADAEAKDFAAEIADLLGAAGWKTHSTQPLSGTAEPVGLFVTIRALSRTAKPGAHVPRALLPAMALVWALRAAGFAPTPDLDTGLADNELLVLIGKAPAAQILGGTATR